MEKSWKFVSEKVYKPCCSYPEECYKFLASLQEILTRASNVPTFPILLNFPYTFQFNSKTPHNLSNRPFSKMVAKKSNEWELAKIKIVYQQ